MNAAKRKLQSCRGASMLMALLLMLVALMVSAVILSAAISAAVDLRAQKESQQSYLTASSAAQLFRDSVLGAGGQYIQKTKVTRTWSDSTKDYVESSRETTVLTEPAGAFAPLMQDALKQIVQNGFTQFYQSYRIEAAGYDPVEMTLAMTPIRENTKLTGVNLLATFSTASSTGHPCQLTLTMDAELQETDVVNTDGEQQITTIAESLKWHKDKATLTTPKTGTEGNS